MKLDSKKRKITLITVIAAILLMVAYLSYYYIQQSRIKIFSEDEFYIDVDTNTYKGAIAEQWVRGYTDQYKQKYIERKREVVDVKVGLIEVLDEENSIVQIDFFVTTKKANTEYFYDWGVIEGDTIRCQWVLDLELNEEGRCYVKSRMTPAAYDLMIYDISGKKDEDEYYHEYIAEKPFEKIQYTYKIEGEKLFVSYDKGESWIEVPVSIEEIMIGSGYKNQLQEGSYEITPEKTSIIYGGTREIPLTLLYSDDQGETWEKSSLLEAYPRYSYVHFTNKNEGHIVITYDKTMGQEASSILTTVDGGKTWTNIGSGPSGYLLREARFYDESLGFFSYPFIEGNETNLYRTEDGGKTFEPVILEEQELSSDIGLQWKQVYDEAQVPELKDGVMTLLVTQGDDGDYEGGNLMARYESHDLGKTWTYIDQVKPAPDPSEG